MRERENMCSTIVVVLVVIMFSEHVHNFSVTYMVLKDHGIDMGIKARFKEIVKIEIYHRGSSSSHTQSHTHMNTLTYHEHCSEYTCPYVT